MLVEELQRLELRIGVVTLVAVALFLLGITWARGIRLGGAQREFVLRFPTAAGLEVGAPVFINGVRQGSVISIKVQDSSALVHIAIEPTVPIRRDATARIGLQELTGGRKVDLFPGTSPEFLPAGAEIPGFASPDVAELIAQLGSLGGEIERVVARLDTVSAALVHILTPQTQQAVRSIADDLALVAERLRTFTEEHGEAIERTADNIAALSTELRDVVAQNRSAASSAVQSLQRASAAAEQTLRRVDSLVGELRSATTHLSSVLEKLQQRTTLAGRLVADEELARQVDSTLALVREFLGQIRQYGVNVNVRLGTRP